MPARKQKSRASARAPHSPRLANLRDVRLELTRVYRGVRHGLLDSAEGSRLCTILLAIGKMTEAIEIEARLASLERLAEQRFLTETHYE